jgi:hypothetical protein
MTASFAMKNSATKEVNECLGNNPVKLMMKKKQKRFAVSKTRTCVFSASKSHKLMY